MAKFIVFKLLIALAIFYLVNLIGGISSGLGYTQIHYQYRRERSPAFNQVFKITTPIIITIMLGTIFHLAGWVYLNKHLWLSLVLSWLIRLCYNFLWEKHSLMNIGIFLIQFLISSIIGIWLYSKLIENSLLLFPSRDNMVSQAWLIAILFLYKVFEDLRPGDGMSERRKNAYIVNSYKKFHRKYARTINKIVSNEIAENIVFAILIIENFNRPKVARIAEHALAPFRKHGTYGLMQVKSRKHLSDIKSIELGAQAVDELFNKIKLASDANRPSWRKEDSEHLSEIVHRTAWIYNNSNNYADEVLYVFNQIVAHTAPKPEPPQIEQFYNAYFSRYHYRT